VFWAGIGVLKKWLRASIDRRDPVATAQKKSLRCRRCRAIEMARAHRHECIDLLPTEELGFL